MVGTAGALHDVAHAIVYHGWNMSLSLGKCEPHGLLAATVLRLFKISQVMWNPLVTDPMCPMGHVGAYSGYTRSMDLCRTNQTTACVLGYCATAVNNSLIKGYAPNL